MTHLAGSIRNGSVDEPRNAEVGKIDSMVLFISFILGSSGFYSRNMQGGESSGSCGAIFPRLGLAVRASKTYRARRQLFRNPAFATQRVSHTLAKIDTAVNFSSGVSFNENG